MQMNDSILIIPSENSVAINKEFLQLTLELPDSIKDIPISKIHSIFWNWCNQSKLCYYDDVLYGQEYKEILLTEDDYESVVKQFSDQFYAEKNRLIEEQAAAEAEYNKFENCQKRAYDSIKEKYNRVTLKPYLISSIGITIDANSSAYTSIDGLISLNQDVENFRDYYNEYHYVNVDQLKIMKSEIINLNSHLKEQKWAFLENIENTTDKAQLESELEKCVFTYLDFRDNSEIAIE